MDARSFATMQCRSCLTLRPSRLLVQWQRSKQRFGFCLLKSEAPFPVRNCPSKFEQSLSLLLTILAKNRRLPGRSVPLDICRPSCLAIHENGRSPKRGNIVLGFCFLEIPSGSREASRAIYPVTSSKYSGSRWRQTLSEAGAWRVSVHEIGRCFAGSVPDGASPRLP